jgi:hypothetical protein
MILLLLPKGKKPSLFDLVVNRLDHERSHWDTCTIRLGDQNATHYVVRI